MEENKVLNAWEELKALLESAELDAQKNAHGTTAAGIRLRKSLRSAIKLTRSLVKTSIKSDKENRSLRKTKREAKKSVTETK